MPVNRNALIRYKTIDLCLQNRYRRWKLDDLIEACSDALYEYEGIGKGVSRRTVQMDIQLMRSDKLGYNAPIVVSEKKYYTYENKEYSIMNIPLSEGDLDKLTETVDFLKQFKGFSHFRELESMVQKLEDHVYSQRVNRKPVIDFEKNEDLKGMEFLERIYQAIIRKNILEITYRSFTARKADTFPFYPCLLKEYRNRWFLIGSKTNGHPLYNLAIDRIVEVSITEKVFIDSIGFDAETYYKNVIGVTVNHGAKVENIVLFVSRKHAPYVLTKPLHPSQKLIDDNGHGITVTLEVQHNFELEKEILGLGDGVVVLSPDRLRANIYERLTNALDLYNTSISEKGIVLLGRKYAQNGFCTVNQLYTRRSINQLTLALSKTNFPVNPSEEPLIIDIESDKSVSSILFTPSLEKVVNQLTGSFSINSVLYYTKMPDQFCEFNQSEGSNPELIVLLSEPKRKEFSLEVIPGSHKKLHSEHERTTIIENCNPAICSLSAGGAIIINSTILKRFSGSLKQEPIRFLVIKSRLDVHPVD